MQSGICVVSACKNDGYQGFFAAAFHTVRAFTLNDASRNLERLKTRGNKEKMKWYNGILIQYIYSIYFISLLSNAR